MVSMINLTPKDLVKIARQFVEDGVDKQYGIVATLVTTGVIVDGKEVIVSQAIVPCMEVKM